MADAKEILQFGIEAARDGNREEARNLFTLLTKQDPNNIQAWLWLAGVSDNPTQRRNALERALQIDPQNEMALRGLRALDGERQSGGIVVEGCSTRHVSVPVHFLGARMPHLHPT